MTNDVNNAVDDRRPFLERDQVDEVIRDNEARLRTIIEQSPIGMAFGRDGVTVDVNAVYLQMFGYNDIEEVRGKPLLDQIAPQCRAEIEERVRRRIQGEPTDSSYETLGMRKDGSQFPVFISAKRVVLKDGPLTFAFLIDITDRKQFEQSLRREGEKNLALLHNASDGIHILDTDGNLIEASNSFCTMLGYQREEMIGMNVCHWDAKLADIDIHKLIRKQLENQGRSQFETLHRRKDGTIFDVEISGSPVELDGKIVLFNSSRDISERKQAEQDLSNSMRLLEEKELAKTRFLAAAGHDLRQPLAAANLFIDALKFTQPTSDQYQIIQRLDQAMSNFNNLLDALLNVSKLDAGVIKAEFISINVSDIFGWLEESFASIFSDKNIRLKLYFPINKVLVVRCDVDLLKSVLMNLVSNAIKFTSKGCVLVSARRRGGDVLFQVWDTGMGIHDENLDKIFYDFYQIDNPQRDRTKGLGLGLSIAKRALALMDGKIVCRSQVGRGSVFAFHLPMDDMQINLMREVPFSKQWELENNRSFVQGKHFVVVEDDTMVSEALSSSLKLMGGQVECFDNPEYALQHANIGNADCYIVDYMLPGDVDGINFLLRLRQKLHKPVCAVMMSGDTSSYFIRKAELFDWPVLHKPVNMSKLISRLSEQYNK